MSIKVVGRLRGGRHPLARWDKGKAGRAALKRHVKLGCDLDNTMEQAAVSHATSDPEGGVYAQGHKDGSITSERGNDTESVSPKASRKTKWPTIHLDEQQEHRLCWQGLVQRTQVNMAALRQHTLVSRYSVDPRGRL